MEVEEEMKMIVEEEIDGERTYCIIRYTGEWTTGEEVYMCMHYI